MREYGTIFFGLILIAIITGPVVNAEAMNLTVKAPSFITIDPVGNHSIGNLFTITGTTNLPVADNLTVEILNYEWFQGGGSRMKNTPISPPYNRGAFEPVVSIHSDIPDNIWSVNVTDDIRPLIPGTYFVFIEREVNSSCTDPENCNLANYSTFYLYPSHEFTSTEIQTTNEPSLSIPYTNHLPGSIVQPSPSIPELSILALAVIVILKSKYFLKRP